MVDKDDLKEALFGLFTEVAMVEHLSRTHLERNYASDLGVAGFGVLNYFIRNRPTPDTIAGIAWSFQEDIEYTAQKVAMLEERSFVTVTPSGSRAEDAEVFITAAGRQIQAEKLKLIGPEIMELVSEIAPDDIKTAFRTLREIRLTLDNLPDR